MSKAFTREDDTPEDALALRPRTGLPGARSPVTRAGHRRLLEAHGGAVSRRDDTEAARLLELLERVEVKPASSDPADVVAFGRGVRTADGEGRARTFWIVGVEEADAAAGRVSLASPLGRALLGARSGDVVDVETPRGDLELHVLEVLPEEA